MFVSVSLHGSMYITGIPSVPGSQKKVSHPLELELQTVMNRHAVASDGFWAFCKRSECS